MNLWGPITLIAAASGVGVAIGFSVAWVFCIGVLADCASIITAMGGFGKTAESQAMTLGFGFMFLIPAVCVTIAAVSLGYVIRGYLASRGINPLEALGTSRIADSQSEATTTALAQFRRGSAIKIRCPSCRNGLAVKRVRSHTGAVPDVEVTCPCGACTVVYPFTAPN